MDPKTFFVNTAGCRIRVQRLGADIDPDDPTLVFLHEGLGNIALWRDFPDGLCRATGLPGIVYERRGYGESNCFETPWPEDYLTTEATVYLPGVLDACGVNRAILIGHSDGGSIALIAAAALPDRILGAVTEAAHIFVEEITLSGIRRALHLFETTDLKARLAWYHGKDVDRIIRRWSNTWLHADFRDWSIQSVLPRITSPLLVLQGQNDEYGTAAQVTGIAQGVSGPVETRLIPDCGHIPHVQAREKALVYMKRFILKLTV